MTQYRANHKQVLCNSQHFADAVSIGAANLITDALNAFDRLETVYHDVQGVTPLGDDIQSMSYGSIPNSIEIRHVDPAKPVEIKITHSIRQENDEYACSCGARWDVSDGHDHP